MFGIVAAFLSQALHSYADGQVLGQGFRVGNHLTLGGYLSVDAAALSDDTDAVTLEDLSALVTVRMGSKWTIFCEAELEDALSVDGEGVHTGGAVFSLERLYLEWQPSDAVRLRVGKQLTPVGIWNVIHAAPLVWTVSRPVTTLEYVDTGVTGIALDLSAPADGLDWRATVFGQATPHLDDTDAAQEFRRALGARVQVSSLEGPAAGLSLVRYRERHDDRDETSVGADLLWSMPSLEVSAEMALNVPDDAAATWGAYVQAVYHMPQRFHVLARPYLPRHLHPVLRVEYADLGRTERVPVVVGLAWKPRPGLVVKLEVVAGGKDTSLGGSGVLASLAVLF